MRKKLTPLPEPVIPVVSIQSCFDTSLFIQGDVFTFGGAKRSGSDCRECKYFPIGMNAREPLWR